MSDKRVGVRIDVGVDGKNDVQDLTTNLDALGRGATGAGQAGKEGAAGTRELGQAAQGAAAGAAQVGKAVGGMADAAGQAGQAGRAGAAGTRELGQAAQGAAGGAAQAGKAVAGMGDAAGQAEGKLGATRRGLESISTQLAETQRSLGNLRDQLIAGFSFKEFVQAAAEMEQVKAGLQAVTGDSKAAGEQMEFVRRMAQAAGVDVAAAGKAFLGLAAATKGTAVEGEPARQVFEAVTLAMAKAGKGSAETQNALLALSQIASKGTVQMEELRGQLGEALPGALQAAAKGLGITTQDLIKLVESGQLAAEDLFPALAKGLNDLYGGAPAAQTLSQEITNIKNAFVEMAANIGDEGALTVLKVGAEVAQTAITYLGDTLIQTGQYIGTLAAAVVSLDFSGLSDAFRQIEEDSRTRLLKAAEHNTVLQGALKLSGVEAGKTAESAQEAFRALERSGTAAAATGTSVAKLGVEYAKARGEIEKQLDVATKEVKAVEARGKASVAQAAALNDEAAKRKAVGQAAADEAGALDKVAQLRVAEVKLLEQERAEKEAALKQAGPISDQRRKELDDLGDLIAKKAVERDTTLAQAAAAREKARATSDEVQAAQALKDAFEDTVPGIQGLGEAARRAGVDVAQLTGGITRGGQESVRTIADLVDQVIKTGVSAERASPVLADAFDKRLQAAATKEEVQRLIVEMERAKAAGYDMGGVISGQLEKARAKAKELNPELQRINQAIRNMGGVPIGEKGPGSSSNPMPGPLPNALSAMRDPSAMDGRDANGRTPEEVERLSRQGGLVDNSYIFSLRDRLNRGDTFSREEIPSIENALRAARDNARMIGSSSVRSLVGVRDAEGWALTLEKVLAQAQGQSLGAGDPLVLPGGLGAGSYTTALRNGQPTDALRAYADQPAATAAPSTTPASTTRTLRLDLGNGRSLDYAATSDAEAARVESLLRTLANESARAG